MDVAPNAGSGTADKTSLPHGPNGKTGRAQTFLALTALGVVFGDIGTSPLYLDRKHYYLAHETVVRREKDFRDGPGIFRDLFVSQPNFEPCARLFQDSPRWGDRSRLSCRSLTRPVLTSHRKPADTAGPR